MWGVGEVNISASIRAPCTKYFLEVAETHRNISRSLGKCFDSCGQSASAPKLGQVEKIHGGVGRSISLPPLELHAPNLFWKFLRHIGTFLDHLGGVETSIGGALVPKNQAKLSKCMGEGEVNISASNRAPCTKIFWRFLRHIGTFVDHLGGDDTPAARVLVSQNWAKVSKYMG